MRTLERNKTSFWYVEPTGTTPILDTDGFDTGERTKTYSVPKEIDITIYPFNGTVVEQIFGKDTSLDMVSLSNDVILTQDALLFLTQPIGNFEKTYDYRVSQIKKSLNILNYGLRNRT